MKKALIVIFLVVSFTVYGSSSPSASLGKYQAMFLYNFTKHMKWPKKKQITIGVVGQTSVLSELNNIAKRSSQITALTLTNPEDVLKCDLIFISGSASKEFQNIQNSIGSRSIILVSDNTNLISQGVEIGFFVENGKLKFALNKSELQSANVMVSEDLYRMAKVI